MLAVLGNNFGDSELKNCGIEPSSKDKIGVTIEPVQTKPGDIFLEKVYHRA